MKKFKSISLVLSAMCALLVAGCGSGGSENSAATSSGGATTQTASALDHTCQLPNFNAEFTSRLNALRASGAVCGGQVMPPAGRLVWNEKLQAAATAHARSMADSNFVSHTGLDGSNPLTRAISVGYTKTDGSVGENIGIYSKSIDAVFSAWVNDPANCKGLMVGNLGFADLVHMAVSCADNPQSAYGRYWVLNIGVDY
jgi:uncharacterized protein YkwD